MMRQPWVLGNGVLGSALKDFCFYMIPLTFGVLGNPGGWTGGGGVFRALLTNHYYYSLAASCVCRVRRTTRTVQFQFASATPSHWGLIRWLRQWAQQKGER